MTFEELKEEAKRQGYKLIKDQPYVPLKRCPICGKKPSEWVNAANGFHSFMCDCERTMNWKKSERMARIAWNESLEGIANGTI